MIKIFMISNFREPRLSERKEATATNNSSIMRNAGKGAKRMLDNTVTFRVRWNPGYLGRMGKEVWVDLKFDCDQP